jgi:hypothetical protein
MSKVSIYKKIKLFLTYKKAIKKNRLILSKNFGLRIDNAHRLYTVINIPDNLIGEAYSLKKSDIDLISENYIREYASELRKYLNTIGIKELYEFYDTKKVGKYSYLLVFGFSLFRSNIFYNAIYYFILPLIIATTLIIISVL